LFLPKIIILNILFLDNEPSLLEVAPLIFEDHHVLTLEDANDIFARIKSFKPDIILLDINLGQASGTELCIMLKADPRTVHLPVVLMTAGYIRAEDSLCGADAIIEKPFDISGLIETVERLITNSPSLQKLTDKNK
jgi:DNA-binding response OmpR family regulator